MRPFLLLFLAFSIRISAQTQFYVSPAGNDGNTGTLMSPWKTIQHGLNNAIPGTTVYLMGGTYQENVVVPTSGTLSNFITLKNYNNQNAVLDGSASTGGPLLQISGKNCICIEGIEFANYSMNDAQGILVNGVCSNVKIQKNKFHDINFSSNANDIPNANTNAQPLIVYGDNANTAITDLYITGNEIYNCRTGYSEALAVNGNVDGFTISGNSVHDNSNIGIDVIGHEGTCANATNDQARNGNVRWNKTWNNISAYATSAGIYVDGGAYCILENNTSYGNGYGIEIGCENVGKSAMNITVRNNLVYKNLESGIVVGGYDYPTNSGKVDHSLICENTLADNNVNSTLALGELVISYTEFVTFRSNLIYSSSNDALIYCESGSQNLSFDFNLYYSPSPLFVYEPTSVNTLSSWSTLVGSDFTSRETDPLMVNPSANNFHLTPLSPAIDMGDSTYMTALGETDMDTMSRIQNGRVDIGADEYGTAVGINMLQNETNNVAKLIIDRTSGDLQVVFYKPMKKDSKVVLLMADGRLAATGGILKGMTTAYFNINSLPPGAYVVYSEEMDKGIKFLK
jgi:hypothetical protein